MDILLFILLLIIAIWFPKVYGWVKFKKKYPILSKKPPTCIMEIGDIVYLGGSKYTYNGKSNTGGLWYLFTPENSITSIPIDREKAISQMESIYGTYGLKWKRI